MRLALIALTISCLFTGLPSQAIEADQQQHTRVESLKLQLADKETEYTAFLDSLKNLNDKVAATALQLADYRSKGKTLTTLRKQALLSMNEQYELLVDNPEQDITEAQNTYRQSIVNQKQNKEHISATIHIREKLKDELAQANIDRFTLANTREALTEEIRIARVDRLRSEFEIQDELDVSQVIDCEPQETFKKCVSRSHLLAKQKASKEFLEKIYNSATEYSIIKQNRNESAARVKILKHKVIAGEFSGQGVYSTSLSVQMQGVLPDSEACTLLNISERYCDIVQVDPIDSVSYNHSSDEPSLDDENVLYELTIRSDQYDDEVFIDDISYGSTRLSVMLSSGAHAVVISKPSFTDYVQEIRLDRNMLIKAELVKTAFNVANGEKIQDLLPSDKLGPDLIGIPAGNFQMGDVKGAGLTNEKPARGEQILQGFAIGQNQITVGDFKHFVDATSYVTEAESGDGCAAFSGGQPQYDSVLNWRNPGFPQTDQHPIVCVTEKDSMAYLQWLSKTTNRKYRLPTEMEWEYVARAGSADNFWWGNDIGNGKANCAYCGSKWSSVSSAPVKSFRANQFGLFDTVGNVWELTQGSNVVARGGAWNFAPKLARTSVRLELPKGFRSNYLGFRALREN